MHLILVVLSSFAVSAVTGLLNVETCKPGETDVTDYIKSICSQNDNKKIVEPVGCVSQKGKELKIGDTVDEDRMRYKCDRKGKSVWFRAIGKDVTEINYNIETYCNIMLTQN